MPKMKRGLFERERNLIGEKHGDLYESTMIKLLINSCLYLSNAIDEKN